ncbi:hypothetical protein AC578_342 [Pseudocercospora eumusae]|uniref:Uncharacterized protein n=1 Tax=Pseudocercospora eumusae TaxID=321146 RepID=A0A139HTS8_9PEZI|nr:hypothetical protein AC578_342 [Pseudocercospora eumusae]
MSDHKVDEQIPSSTGAELNAAPVEASAVNESSATQNPASEGLNSSFNPETCILPDSDENLASEPAAAKKMESKLEEANKPAGREKKGSSGGFSFRKLMFWKKDKKPVEAKASTQEVVTGA